LRTRIELVGALTPAGRKRFVREAIAAVAAHLKAISRETIRRRRSGDRLRAVAAAGAEAALTARKKWLRSVASEVASGSAKGRKR
jgi:hypothetical protein